MWAYNNSAVQTLQRVLRNATGQDVAAFAEQHLFKPAGMTSTTMTRDERELVLDVLLAGPPCSMSLHYDANWVARA